MSDLSKLRAEVEALRDEARARSDEPTLHQGVAAAEFGKAVAYGTVLDLIDKHAREA